MSRFRIGQKVVALKSTFSGLVEGRIYTILKIMSFCCGDPAVDIGIKRVGNLEIECLECGKIRKYNVWWHHEDLFAPLEEDGTTKELVKEIEVEEFITV